MSLQGNLHARPARGGVDPEEALRAANRRWVDRYAAVERLAGDRGLVLADLDAAAKDELWNEVKYR